MTSALRCRLPACILLALAAAVPQLAGAQPTWPARPVRVILPFAAGGSVDIVARVLAQKLGASLGQQFLVENRPGASGNIGTEQVVKAAPDGYTLLVIPDSNATINPHIFPGMTFNPSKDLQPVSLLSSIGVGLVVHPSVKADSVADYVAYAKAQAGGLSFGSPGTGTPHHLAGELLKETTGARLVHVPYKGGGPALLDVVGNQIPSAFVALAIAAPHVKAGKLKLLAVTQSTRSSLFPATPTVGETVKGFDVTSWMGLFAPADTPQEIVQRLNAETKKALLEPATSQQLAAQSLEVVASTPAELRTRILQEYERWGKLIKANNISATP